MTQQIEITPRSTTAQLLPALARAGMALHADHHGGFALVTSSHLDLRRASRVRFLVRQEISAPPHFGAGA